MRSRLTLAVFLATGVFTLSAAQALAANLTVAPRKASFGCAKNAQYFTISSAVAAANPGDQITVCPGTYQETVAINKANLQLQSQQPLQATIKAPHSPITAIVAITAPNVKLTGFTITNSGQTSSPNSIQYGIYVSGGGSANVVNSDISDISDAPISGDQNGVAVEAGDSTVPTSGSVTLTHDTIEDYQKNGVTVDGTGSSGDIEQTTIIGVGPTSTTAQNGIQISSGATGVIKNDTISNNVYSPGTVASTGILLCGQGTTDVESNTASTNDVGIYDAANDSAGGCGGASGSPKATIKSNTIIASTFDGLVLDGEHGAQVQSDQAAGTWGHTAYGADQGDGFDIFNTTASLLQGSTAPGNSEDGFHNESNSTGNTYGSDQAPANLTFDCADDSTGGTGPGGVANTWQGDMGDVNSPQTLCKGDPSVAASNSSSAATPLLASPQAQAVSDRPAPSPAS